MIHTRLGPKGIMSFSNEKKRTSLPYSWKPHYKAKEVHTQIYNACQKWVETHTLISRAAFIPADNNMRFIVWTLFVKLHQKLFVLVYYHFCVPSILSRWAVGWFSEGTSNKKWKVSWPWLHYGSKWLSLVGILCSQVKNIKC